MTDGLTSKGQPLLQNQSYKELGVIAKGGMVNLVGALFFLVSGFVFQIVIAKALGPANVGIINLGVTIINLVLIVVLFGLDQAIVRNIAYYMGTEDREREIGAILSSFRILFVTTTVITPLFWFGSRYLAISVFQKPELAPFLQILAFSLPLMGVFRLIIAITQAYKRMEYRAVIEQIIVPVAKISGTILLFYVIGFKSISVAYAILLSTLVGFTLSVFVLRRFYSTRKENRKPIFIGKDLLRFAWPFVLTGIITRTNVQTETLVLGALASSEQVGIYTIGLKATVLITVFINALNIIFAPVIAELFAKGDMERLSFQFKTVTRWAFTFALPVALAMIFAAPEVMKVFGSEFLIGISVFQMLALSQLVFVVTGPAGLMLAMTKYPRLNLLNAILTITLSLILDFALIPSYGAFGAALAGAITITFINLLRLGEVYAVLHMHPYNWSYIKPMIAGGVAILATYGASNFVGDIFYLWRLFILSAILSTTYILTILLMRLDETDKEMFSTILRKLRGIGVSSKRPIFKKP